MPANNAEPTWTKHPEAYAAIVRAVDQFVDDSPAARELHKRMLCETGTDLFDWVDRISLELAPTELEQLGFQWDSTEPGEAVLFRHPAALLPAVLTNTRTRLIAIRVESVIDFLQAHRIDSRCTIVGVPGASMRRACIEPSSQSELWVVERHGDRSWQPTGLEPQFLNKLWRNNERFRLRQRDFETVEQGFDHAARLIELAVSDLGRDRACDTFFASERAYWQYRNDAGQMQRLRQDRLGLGWSNHDHHTYRSSRVCFHRLIACLEMLGLECRERFYAGREAGWGAQVMEQPNCGIVVFADVDLGQEEIVHDISHQPMADRRQLGTVGLWCALHGEAFLQAGMHHLECQFDFDSAISQLESVGIQSMNPFTDLAHLRQAFTKGQRWQVSEVMLKRALDQGWIDLEQAAKFRDEGAIGSHLEILQRRDGFKGFNPKGISDIISETDPRRIHV